MTDLVIAVLVMAACIYGSSSTAKLSSRRSFRAFRDGLAETALVRPGRRLAAVAAVLAGGEAVTAATMAVSAVLTVAGTADSATAVAIALGCGVVLTSALTDGVAIVLRTGTRATCACFGAGSGRQINGSHLVRNIAVLALLLAGLAGNEFRHGRTAPGAVITSLVAGIVLALLLIRFDDLAGLFAPAYPSTTTPPDH
jgi:hypothetical protein